MKKTISKAISGFVTSQASPAALGLVVFATKLREKSYYPDLIVDAFGIPHGLMPFMRGGTIGLNNTCKTTLELMEFFGVGCSSRFLQSLNAFKADLMADRDFLRGIPSQAALYQEKIRRLEIAEQFISLFTTIHQMSVFSNVSNFYKTLQAMLLEAPRTCVSITLSPNPTDSARRLEFCSIYNLKKHAAAGDQGFGDRLRVDMRQCARGSKPKEETSVPQTVVIAKARDVVLAAINSNKKLAQQVQITTGPVDTATQIPFTDEVIKDVLIPGLVIAMRECLNEKIEPAEMLRIADGGMVGQAINVAFFENMCTGPDDGRATVEEALTLLVGARQLPAEFWKKRVSEQSARTAFEAFKFVDDPALWQPSRTWVERLSLLVQFFVGYVGFYCYMKGLSTQDFGVVLDRFPGSMTKAVRDAFAKDRSVESALLHEIQSGAHAAHYNLKRPLKPGEKPKAFEFTPEEVAEIVEGYTANWEKIYPENESTPHHDEYLLADFKRPGTVLLHGNKMVVLFSEFLLKLESTLDDFAGNHQQGDLFRGALAPARAFLVRQNESWQRYKATLTSGELPVENPRLQQMQIPLHEEELLSLYMDGNINKLAGLLALCPVTPPVDVAYNFPGLIALSLRETDEPSPLTEKGQKRLGEISRANQNLPILIKFLDAQNCISYKFFGCKRGKWIMTTLATHADFERVPFPAVMRWDQLQIIDPAALSGMHVCVLYAIAAKQAHDMYGFQMLSSAFIGRLMMDPALADSLRAAILAKLPSQDQTARMLFNNVFQAKKLTLIIDAALEKKLYSRLLELYHSEVFANVGDGGLLTDQQPACRKIKKALLILRDMSLGRSMGGYNDANTWDWTAKDADFIKKIQSKLTHEGIETIERQANGCFQVTFCTPGGYSGAGAGDPKALQNYKKWAGFFDELNRNYADICFYISPNMVCSIEKEFIERNPGLALPTSDEADGAVGDELSRVRAMLRALFLLPAGSHSSLTPDSSGRGYIFSTTVDVCNEIHAIHQRQRRVHLSLARADILHKLVDQVFGLGALNNVYDNVTPQKTDKALRLLHFPSAEVTFNGQDGYWVSFNETDAAPVANVWQQYCEQLPALIKKFPELQALLQPACRVQITQLAGAEESLPKVQFLTAPDISPATLAQQAPQRYNLLQLQAVSLYQAVEARLRAQPNGEQLCREFNSKRNSGKIEDSKIVATFCELFPAINNWEQLLSFGTDGNERNTGYTITTCPAIYQYIEFLHHNQQILNAQRAVNVQHRTHQAEQAQLAKHTAGAVAEMVNTSRVKIFAPHWVPHVLRMLSLELIGTTVHFPDGHTEVITQDNLNLSALLIMAHNEQSNNSGAFDASLYRALPMEAIITLKDLARECVIIGHAAATHIGPAHNSRRKLPQAQPVIVCASSNIEFLRRYNSGRLFLIDIDPAYEVQGRFDDVIFRNLVGEVRSTVVQCQQDPKRYRAVVVNGRTQYFDTVAYERVIAQDFIKNAIGANYIAHAENFDWINFKFLQQWIDASAGDLQAVLPLYMVRGIRQGLITLFRDFPEYCNKIKNIILPYFPNIPEIPELLDLRRELNDICMTQGHRACTVTHEDPFEQESAMVDGGQILIPSAVTTSSTAHAAFGNQMCYMGIEGRLAENLELQGLQFNPVVNQNMQVVLVSALLPELRPQPKPGQGPDHSPTPPLLTTIPQQSSPAPAASPAPAPSPPKAVSPAPRAAAAKQPASPPALRGDAAPVADNAWGRDEDEAFLAGRRSASPPPVRGQQRVQQQRQQVLQQQQAPQQVVLPVRGRAAQVRATPIMTPNNAPNAQAMNAVVAANAVVAGIAPERDLPAAATPVVVPAAVVAPAAAVVVVPVAAAVRPAPRSDEALVRQGIAQWRLIEFFLQNQFLQIGSVLIRIETQLPVGFDKSSQFHENYKKLPVWGERWFFPLIQLTERVSREISEVMRYQTQRGSQGCYFSLQYGFQEQVCRDRSGLRNYEFLQVMEFYVKEFLTVFLSAETEPENLCLEILRISHDMLQRMSACEALIRSRNFPIRLWDQDYCDRWNQFVIEAGFESIEFPAWIRQIWSADVATPPVVAADVARPAPAVAAVVAAARPAPAVVAVAAAHQMPVSSPVMPPAVAAVTAAPAVAIVPNVSKPALPAAHIQVPTPAVVVPPSDASASRAQPNAIATSVIAPSAIDTMALFGVSSLEQMQTLYAIHCVESGYTPRADQLFVCEKTKISVSASAVESASAARPVVASPPSAAAAAPAVSTAVTRVIVQYDLSSDLPPTSTASRTTVQRGKRAADAVRLPAVTIYAPAWVELKWEGLHQLLRDTSIVTTGQQVIKTLGQDAEDLGLQDLLMLTCNQSGAERALNYTLWHNFAVECVAILKLLARECLQVAKVQLAAANRSVYLCRAIGCKERDIEELFVIKPGDCVSDTAALWYQCRGISRPTYTDCTSVRIPKQATPDAPIIPLPGDNYFDASGYRRYIADCVLQTGLAINRQAVADGCYQVTLRFAFEFPGRTILDDPDSIKRLTHEGFEQGLERLFGNFATESIAIRGIEVLDAQHTSYFCWRPEACANYARSYRQVVDARSSRQQVADPLAAANDVAGTPDSTVAVVYFAHPHLIAGCDSTPTCMENVLLTQLKDDKRLFNSFVNRNMRQEYIALDPLAIPSPQRLDEICWGFFRTFIFENVLQQLTREKTKFPAGIQAMQELQGTNYAQLQDIAGRRDRSSASFASTIFKGAQDRDLSNFYAAVHAPQSDMKTLCQWILTNMITTRLQFTDAQIIFYHEFAMRLLISHPHGPIPFLDSALPSAPALQTITSMDEDPLSDAQRWAPVRVPTLPTVDWRQAALGGWAQDGGAHGIAISAPPLMPPTDAAAGVNFSLVLPAVSVLHSTHQEPDENDISRDDPNYWRR